MTTEKSGQLIWNKTITPTKKIKCNKRQTRSVLKNDKSYIPNIKSRAVKPKENYFKQNDKDSY